MLAIDIGSSSVKAARLKGTDVVGRIRRVPFETRQDGASVEVDAHAVLAAVAKAVDGLTRRIDAVVLGVMSPAFCLLDKNGRPLTPLITHQDRRSVAQSQQLANEVGEARFRHLSGLAPVPGGVAATSYAWLAQHAKGTVRRAATFAMLNTLVHAQLTGRRVIDPGNAGFTGLWSVQDQAWSDELLQAAGVPRSILPEVHDGATTFNITANTYGLPEGVPLTVGVIDGSGLPLLVDAKTGTLTNTIGSTDVLALVTDQPKTGEGLMCRHVGTRGQWLAVATEAAAGSAVDWARQTLFADMRWPTFEQEMHAATEAAGVRFNPSLAGSRLSVDQPTGGFSGLTLGTTRRHLLAAVLAAMTESSARRLKRLQSLGVPMSRTVLTSGGGGVLEHRLHSDWGRRWKFKEEVQGSLRGLGRLLRA